MFCIKASNGGYYKHCIKLVPRFALRRKAIGVYRTANEAEVRMVVKHLNMLEPKLQCRPVCYDTGKDLA